MGQNSLQYYSETTSSEVMEGVGVEGGTGQGEKMVTSEVRRGVTTCCDAKAIAGEGHFLGVGSHCCFLLRGEYLLPMW